MLSNRANYALKALSVLAANYGGEPVLIAHISTTKNIPLKFLQAILLQLKQQNILGSKKGKGGGYYLLQQPKQTSIASVLRIVDGPIALLPCASLNFYKQCVDCDEVNCKLKHIFTQTRDATLKILNKKTLASLL